MPWHFGTRRSFPRLRVTQDAEFQQAPSIVGTQLVTPRLWAGILSQSGEDHPTGVEVANTFGHPFELVRVGVGDYHLRLAGAFTRGKTFVMVNAFTASDIGYSFIVPVFGNPDYVELITFDSTSQQDGILSDSAVEVRVYP